MRKHNRVQTELVEWRNPEVQVRVAVDVWHQLAVVDNQYIQPRPGLVQKWRYLRRFGLRASLRKARSRQAEHHRNVKVAGCGLGVLLEVPEVSDLRIGDKVVFFAPNSPPDPKFVSLDRSFVARNDTPENQRIAGTPEIAVPEELVPYVGWSPYGGVPINAHTVFCGLAQVMPSLCLREQTLRDHSMTERHCRVVERVDCDRARTGAPTAVLFGLGHYAKTQILPRILKTLDLRCIHEVDPQQLLPVLGWNVALDTSPMPRQDEAYDAWFIAGYHHLHADIALDAMIRGAYAVVEKPLATSRRQIDSLVHSIEAGSGALFACFQRRYTPMNRWAREDMQLKERDPVNYHCIVYEIPLPSRHWYNWPSSRGRLTSNGCHWVDHFLFLNSFPDVIMKEVARFGNGDLMVALETDNGATFSMLLTDHGSGSLGVRDHVELRARDVTVTMIDQTHYIAEGPSRILRRRRINPLKPYAEMYTHITDAILQQCTGETVTTLLSTEVVVELEDKLERNGQRCGKF